jgi:hypothetical protein
MEQQEAADYCSLNDGVPGVWAAAREGLSLIKALREMGLLSSDFPLKGPVVIECDSEAAISLCKDHKEGQHVKHIDIMHHFARDHVARGELFFCFLSLRTM